MKHRVYTFFLLTDLQVRPVGGFWWLKRRGLTQGCAFLEVENSKLISNPWKIPQKSKIGQKNGLKNFRPKTLLYKNFTYKRPLIVIVGT